MENEYVQYLDKDNVVIEEVKIWFRKMSIKILKKKWVSNKKRCYWNLYIYILVILWNLSNWFLYQLLMIKDRYWIWKAKIKKMVS